MKIALALLAGIFFLMRGVWCDESFDEKDSIYDRNPDVVHFQDEVEEHEVFYTHYNNVPIVLEVYGSTIFVTVPRRRYVRVKKLFQRIQHNEKSLKMQQRPTQESTTPFQQPTEPPYSGPKHPHAQ